MGLDDEGEASEVTGHDGGVEVGEEGPEGLCMGQLGWIHINSQRIDALESTCRRRCI